MTIEKKEVLHTDYNEKTYKELITLIPKRLMILFIKLTSIKVLIPVPVAVWALANGLINQWVFFLIFVMTFSLRSFEKIIDKNTLKF